MKITLKFTDTYINKYRLYLVMLTDRQKETFKDLKEGKLTPKQKADFYYRMSNILKDNLEGLEDVAFLLNEIPASYLEKINLIAAATSAMKFTEKLIETTNPPQVRKKNFVNATELEAVKCFDFGPLNETHYFKDANGEEHELKTFGYSLARNLTEDEKTLIYNISWHVDSLKDMIVPRREVINCSPDEFLATVAPAWREEARRKGVMSRVWVDTLGTIWPLDDIASLARKIKAEQELKAKEDQEKEA